MATAAVIGEPLAVEGWALAGVLVYPADSHGEAAAAWAALPSDTALVIMTASAAGWLDAELASRPDIITTVLRP